LGFFGWLLVLGGLIWLGFDAYQSWNRRSDETLYAYCVALVAHLLAWLPVRAFRKSLLSIARPGVSSVILAGAATVAAGAAMLAATWLEGSYISTGVSLFAASLAGALAIYSLNEDLNNLAPVMLAICFAMSIPNRLASELDCVVSLDVRAQAVLPRAQTGGCLIVGPGAFLSVPTLARSPVRPLPEPRGRSEDRTVAAFAALLAAGLAVASAVSILPFALFSIWRKRRRQNCEASFAHVAATLLLASGIGYVAVTSMLKDTGVRTTSAVAPGLLMAWPLQLASRAWPVIEPPRPPVAMPAGRKRSPATSR
jgi:hypothetical protein